MNEPERKASLTYCTGLAMTVGVRKVSVMLINAKGQWPKLCHSGKMVRMCVFRTAALSHPSVWYI